MKKVIKLLAFTSMTLLLTACSGDGGYKTGEIVGDGAYKVVGQKGRYDILRDLEHGCLYLEPNNDLGLTPYYGEDGEVQGCGQEETLPKYK